MTEMKQGWEIKMLKDIGIAQTGTTPKTADKDNYGDFIPFIKPADIDIYNDGEIRYDNDGLTQKGLNSGRKMSEGSILMVCIGATIGKVGFVDRDVSCNQQINSLTVKKDYHPKFVYYALSTPNFHEQVIQNSAQATLPIINKGKWECLSIPYPKSFAEQQRIVSILDEAFAAIAKAKANAEQNLKNAKELFESYLQGVFSNGKLKMENGEWEEKTLGEIADVEYGYTDKSTEEGDYRYIRITDIDKNGELILEDKKYIKHSKEAEGFLIQDNDLLMARTGATFAKVLLFNGDEPSVFASYLIRIKFKEKFENALYWHFTKTKKYWEQANSLQSGAAQPHFNGAAVKQVVFAYPKSVKEQKDLIKKFEVLSIETKKLEAIYQQKILDLEELKKSVLQKAFAGELKTEKAVLV